MIYFEINDHFIKKFGAKYLHTQSYNQTPFSVIYSANRIWYLNTATHEVSWLKHRQLNLTSPVDPAEFLLVQIRSKPYVKDSLL